jgi:hypothetical protein
MSASEPNKSFRHPETQRQKRITFCQRPKTRSPCSTAHQRHVFFMQRVDKAMIGRDNTVALEIARSGPARNAVRDKNVRGNPSVNPSVPFS